MKKLVDFISESTFTKNGSHMRKNNDIRDELYEYVDKYCDPRDGTSDNVGGAIAGALAYMLGRWRNDGNTCENNNRVKRANRYLCDDTELLMYSEKFSDLERVSYHNYEKYLYDNISVAVDYFEEYPEIFKEKNTYFNLFE